MDWLADQIETISKQASELTMYDVKSAVNKAKNMVLNLSEIESKVREATNDDPWGASSTLMQEIAQATFNFQLFNEIMPTIYARFTEKEARQWRQIYKGLVLLEYLVKNGSERVIDDARTHLSLIKVLRNFHYTDENGKDQGINVRNRSKELAELLSDLDRVRMERRKAKQNRNKYTGVGNDGFGGGGPSFTSATGSRYGGFGSDSFEGGSGDRYSGNGGGHSGGFSDSRGRNNDDFEEYDAGEWDDRRGASGGGSSSRGGGSGAGSRSSAAASRSTSKPTPAPPKAEPPKPEVNLFDFDEDEQQPTPPPKFTATMPNAADDDDFDDFQSATPAAAPIAAPAAPGKPHQNVFDLLKAQPARPTMAPAPPAASPSPVTTSAAASSSSMMSSFAPMQASRPVMQPQTASYASASSSSGTAPSNAATSAAKKPASDFSDLFGDFGGVSSKSSTMGASGAAGQPKLTMAQIQAQKRQDSLFAASNQPAGNVAYQSNGSAAGNGSGGGDGWDSLL